MSKTTISPKIQEAHADALLSQHERASFSGLAFTSLAIAASLIVSILMLEFCLAVAGVGEEEYLQRDPEVGWVMIPKKHITWRHEGYSTTQVNSAGMVERELPRAKDENTLRIAVIGDSYVEALQVPREQNFCRLIEKTFAKSAEARGKKIEVLNFGISAYNTAQLYIRLKNLAIKYNPDIVIIAESVDATRYLSPEGGGFFRARPTFTLNEKNELVCDYSKQDAWLQSPEGVRVRSTAWLRKHSHIWGVVAKAAEQITMFVDELERGDAKFGAPVTEKKTTFEKTSGPACINGVFIAPEAVFSPELPSVNLPHKMAALRKWWPVHAELLQQMKEECDSADALMVMLRLPQVNAYDNTAETKLLKEFAASNAIQFIDSTKIFADFDDEKVPLFYDPHLSSNGHQLLAKQLCAELAPVIEAKLHNP